MKTNNINITISAQAGNGKTIMALALMNYLESLTKSIELDDDDCKRIEIKRTNEQILEVLKNTNVKIKTVGIAREPRKYLPVLRNQAITSLREIGLEIVPENYFDEQLEHLINTHRCIEEERYYITSQDMVDICNDLKVYTPILKKE